MVRNVDVFSSESLMRRRETEALELRVDLV